MIVGAAITSQLVLVARSPPSSPGPLLPPAGEGETRLGVGGPRDAALLPAGEGETRLGGWAGRVMLLYCQR